MIEYKHGDILLEDAEAIINTVNCEGVMGRGIALQFKNSYPENFKAYAKACKNNEVQPGRMFVFETGQLTNPHYIINFPTKRHWRGNSRMEDIEAGLKALVATIQQYNIGSIAIPPLGSGLGGLNRSSVKRRIEAALQPLSNVRVIIFEPKGAPDEVAKNSKVPAMTPGRAALVELINRYLNGLLDPFDAQSIDDVIRHTYSWNKRKQQFTPRQITLAAEILSNKGWVKKLEMRGKMS
jgi:O-acetyl-ADP-ribose deacetylase (regulator of RNase III)